MNRGNRDMLRIYAMGIAYYSVFNIGLREQCRFLIQKHPLRGLKNRELQKRSEGFRGLAQFSKVTFDSTALNLPA